MATKVQMFCPGCNATTDFWDNRQTKRNPKAPDFKCCTCQKAIWEKKANGAPNGNFKSQTTNSNGLSVEFKVLVLLEEIKKLLTTIEVNTRPEQYDGFNEPANVEEEQY